MHEILNKKQILTIPNLMSVVRLALIPLFVWLYSAKEAYKWAVAVLLLSGATDILDGIVARKFHMVSDFGKILDPVADKLTQAAVILCLAAKHPWMIALILLFAAKELVMAVLGYVAIQKKGTVHGAKWYGKANTVLLYAVMMALILFPQMPEMLANTLILLCGISMLLSLAMYMQFYSKLLSPRSQQTDSM